MYKYEEIKPKIFTENGSVIFIAIRDNVHQLLGLSGAVRMHEAIKNSNGDSWLQLACVDRLVELGEIKEITKNDGESKRRVRLEICAPLKDMELREGTKVIDGYRLSHPDPVVLLPIQSPYWGYLILTAWGDEASDELIVNQKMN